MELAEPRRQGKSGDNVLEDKPSCTLFIDNFTSFFPRSVLHFLVFVHDGRLGFVYLYLLVFSRPVPFINNKFINNIPSPSVCMHY